MSYIKVKNLSLDFSIYGYSSKSLKKTTVNLMTGGLLGEDEGKHVKVRALDNLNFNLFEGDRLALIGHNGSGKCTLLRVLAGTYWPTEGDILIKGSIASMLSITIGIDGEATGIENIRTRGLLMGLSKIQITRLIDDVTEFSELGNFIHMPMRTYSTGMTMRLAFGIATSIPADIVLMDEWLSVGDENFSKKAELRLKKILNHAKIFVLATHSSGLVESVCNKVFHMEHGKIININ